MEQIWAPWRMSYIANADKHEGCFFCDKPNESNDVENYIILRGEHAFILLNAYPYSNGHLMVAPYQHTANMDELSNEEMLEMMQLTRRAVNLLKTAFHPDGFNVGVNMGRVAGAGVADHLHIHVVPRWNGDTNFMLVLGDVRVIPESLESVYVKLRTVLEEEEGK